MSFNRLLQGLASTLFTLSALLGNQVTLAAYPEKPIRMIVPFAPGGGTDQISRALGAGLAQQLGQPVVIENKPGAGTVIGMDTVAKAAPDGYSLVMATFAHAVNPSLQAKLPYSNDNSFAPVALIGRGPNVLVVRAGSPFKSVADVIAAAKARPGVLTYASQGNGTSAHLAGEMFNNLAKVEMTHIPYRGAGPAMTDVLGGQVDMIFGTAAAVSPLLASGKMRALAVTSAAPSPAFQGIPTIAQTIPDYAVESWYGLYAPKGAPPEIINQVNRATLEVLQNEVLRDRLIQRGFEPIGNSPKEFASFISSEIAKWAKVVRLAGIEPE